jgi:hypothetical protein
MAEQRKTTSRTNEFFGRFGMGDCRANKAFVSNIDRFETLKDLESEGGDGTAKLSQTLPLLQHVDRLNQGVLVSAAQDSDYQEWTKVTRKREASSSCHKYENISPLGAWKLVSHRQQQYD